MNKPSVFTIEGKGIAEVWENAVVRTWKEGCSAYTEYDQWSKDSTMLMVVNDALSEPRDP